MTKRKLSTGEAAPAKEVEAAEEEQQLDEEDPCAPGPIDVDPLKWLIEPQDVSSFVDKHWERAPLHVPANEERKKFFEGLFDFEALAKLSDALEAGTMILYDQDPGPKGDALTLADDVDDAMCRAVGPLMFGRDVVAVRYIDGKRETIEGDFADSDTLRSLHGDANATLQLHQPQRFINGIWRLVAALEAALGCLVGCNAYITPAKGQGLAPHHDDVELFVCQTAGTKQWKVYKPTGGYELPSAVSGDLPQEGLGEPVLEVTMAPGDVLYLPRGYVHQAVAQEAGSCHLTISTYQKWTWGNLAEAVLQQALGSSGDPKCGVPLELRRGLPLGLLWKAGMQAELGHPEAADATARSAATALAAGLRALAGQLEAAPADMLTAAVDDIAVDFLLNRMPPHPCQLPDEGPVPSLDDSLAVRGLNLFRLVPVEVPEGGVSEDEDEDEDEDEEEEEGRKAYVKLVTCLENSRFTHMISGGDDDDSDYEDDDEEHDHEHGHCGDPTCHLAHGGSDDDDSDEDGEQEGGEDEEGEKEKEGEEKVKSAEKGRGKRRTKKALQEEEEAAAAAAAEAEAEAEAAKKKKKGGKKEEGGEEAEAMDTSGEGEDEEGGEGEEDDDDGDDEGDDDDDDEEEEEEEEKELQGPIFPAEYAPALAELLAATPERPLPVRSLKVPGGTGEEALRLAQVLHEFGFVVTVPAAKKEEKEKEEEGAKGKKEGAAKKAAGKEGDKSAEKAPKSAEKKGKKGEEKEKEKGEEKAAAKSAEKGKKAAEKGEEKAAASPPAKKAKKGGK